jgi:hypothetical protein
MQKHVVHSIIFFLNSRQATDKQVGISGVSVTLSIGSSFALSYKWCYIEKKIKID